MTMSIFETVFSRRKPFRRWLVAGLPASLVLASCIVAFTPPTDALARGAATWTGAAVSSRGAPALPAGVYRKAPQASAQPPITLPKGTSLLVRALLTPRPVSKWAAVCANGMETAGPAVRGRFVGGTSSTPFTVTMAPGMWNWRSSQAGDRQMGDRLYAWYGPPPARPFAPAVASPYQYAFAMFPDEEFTLVQLMLSTKASAAGKGVVAGQPVQWLLFKRRGQTLRVAVDARTGQVFAIVGIVGVVGNHPPERIDDRVVSYSVLSGSQNAAASTAGIAKPGDVHVFSSFREAQRQSVFAVVAPRLDPHDLVWSLGKAGPDIMATILTPDGEVTLSEANGFPESGWGVSFEPTQRAGAAFAGASAGAGGGAYGRFGQTGIVISTYTVGALGGTVQPSLADWVHWLPARLQTPIDWGAYNYTLPIYPGASAGGKGSMAWSGSDVYWYEPANPAAGGRGRAVLYETRHAQTGQNLRDGAEPLAVLPRGASGFIEDMTASGPHVAALVRAGDVWTVVEAATGTAYRWTFSAARSSIPSYLTSVKGGFVFTTPHGSYRITWGSRVAVKVSA
ncbi:MAG: hypothetical protein ACYCVB_16005 [Bacilli bacterium]